MREFHKVDLLRVLSLNLGSPQVGLQLQLSPYHAFSDKCVFYDEEDDLRGHLKWKFAFWRILLAHRPCCCYAKTWSNFLFTVIFSLINHI